MNIGIFGGTFDPIHLGHLSMARSAQKQYLLGKVLFVPAFIPPHKIDHQSMTGPEDRARMVELAIDDQLDFEICTFELDQKKVSYTIETVNHVSSVYPDAKLYLILGADSFARFDRWKDAEKIREKAALLVAPRKGYDEEISSMKNAFAIDMEKVIVASSDIRDMIKAGSEGLDGVMPEKVLHYVRQKGVYQNEGSSR